MIIRSSDKNDVSAIKALVESLAHFYLNEKVNELPEWFIQTITVNEILARIDNPECSNYVCEHNGEIVGYIAMIGKSYLYHLFVAEQHQRKGIGRALWNYAKAQCKSDRYTLRSSINAIPVYKKLGFTESDSVGERDGICFQPMELIV